MGSDEACHRRSHPGADRRGAGADSGDGSSPPDAVVPGREVRRARLVPRYHSRQVVLHGECLYNGLCEPLDET